MKPLKVILPINQKPSIISYAHTAFNDCILSGPLMSDEKVVEFSVDTPNTDWRVHTNGGSIQIGAKTSDANTDTDKSESSEKSTGVSSGRCKDTSVIVSSNGTKTRGHCVMYRPVQKDDYVIVKVTSRRAICSWECIDLVLETHEPDASYDIEGSLVNLMCPLGRELFIRQSGALPELKDHPHMVDLPFWLKLEKKDYQIFCSYSYNGRSWHEVYTYDLLPRMRISTLYIGVLVELRNDYHNWKACNYIQTYMKREWDNSLFWDYYLGPIKHYKPLYPAQFLDFSHEIHPYRDMNRFKIIKLLHHRLLEQKYIFFFLNHLIFFFL